MTIGLGTVVGPQTEGPLATLQPMGSLDLYMAGLKVWTSPGAALTALGTTLGNFGQAVSGPVLPATLGLWTPPLILAGFLLSRGRRR